MKLYTYQANETVKTGILSQDGAWIYPTESFGLPYKTMLGLISHMTACEREALKIGAGQQSSKVNGAVKLEQAKLLAPIPQPKQDVICLGINYMDHAEESARYKKEAFGGDRPFAIYFSKRVWEAVADQETIQSHRSLVERLDYEAELAVIIGKDAKDVAQDQVKDYIFGYTIINDVSARDVQTRHKQWYFGKSLDGFTPMGPCITTTDDLEYPPKLQIQSRVNGELRQNSNTELLIFGIDHIVSELSRGMTLRAGTIIATGTPAGVGMGFDPPRFLQPKDVVECRIEGIGTLTNVVGE